MSKVAWVAGATGLIGSHLMNLLSESRDYERVIAFVRKKSDAPWASHPKVAQWVVDFDDLKANTEDEHVDDVFCALGSTTKKTPDKQTYFKIDVEYPLAFADLALKHGANYYGLVSANGAKASSLSNYLKMKGQLEDRLKGKGFERVAIAQPSLLKGDRQEFRLGERLSEHVLNFFPGNLKAIDSIDVAAALLKGASNQQAGVSVLSSKSMQRAFKALA